MTDSPKKTERICILVSAKLKQQLQQAAQEQEVTVSEFLRQTARKSLDSGGRKTRPKLILPVDQETI